MVHSNDDKTFFQSVSVGILEEFRNQVSDGQGFENPQGYVGKGMKGQGRGKDFPTPTKPLPLTGVWGYPQKF